MGQGRENAKQFLKEHPDLAQALDAKLREALGLTKPTPSVAETKAKLG